MLGEMKHLRNQSPPIIGILSILCLVLTFPLLLFSQTSIQFTRFAPEDGFVQGIVTDLHQDKSGLIWIATADGLFKYDGYEFFEYRNNGSIGTSISGNTVMSVTSDAANNLWIGIDGGGINRINRKTGELIILKNEPTDPSTIPSSSISCLIVAKDGSILAGTRNNGLIKVSPDDFSFTNYTTSPGTNNGLPSLGIDYLFQEQSERVWVATTKGELVFYDTKDQTFSPAPTTLKDALDGAPIMKVLQEDHIFWIGTSRGLLKYDHQQDQVQQIDTPLSDIRAICRGPQGLLWLAGFQGLASMNTENWSAIKYEADEDNPQKLSNNRVSNLLLDHQGLLWVGTWGKDLNRIDFQPSFFNYWGQQASDTHEALSSKNIKSIHQTKDSILWIGTEAHGLNRLDRKTGKVKIWNTQNGLSHNKILSLAGNEAGLWIGTGKGINYYHYATARMYSYPNTLQAPLSSYIWALYLDHEDHLWIGTSDGFAMLKNYIPGQANLDYELIDPSLEQYNGLNSNSIRDIIQDHNQDYWIATSDGGLNFYDGDDFKAYTRDLITKDSIPGPYLYNIMEARDSSLWISTPRGAYHFDLQKGSFSRLTEKDGLPNDYVFGIYEDKNKELWMPTNRGIFRYNPLTQAYQVYDILDGLQSNEFNQGAHFQDPRTGEIFFGGVGGLNSFLPNQFKQNTFVPPLVFTTFRYYNKEDQGDAKSILEVNQLENIALTYRDNIIEIGFAALNYLYPEKNQYRYRLLGFDDQWYDLDNQHQLRFTNLDPGKYTLEIQGSNNDKVWNEEGRQLYISISPPWWETNLAKGIFVLLFVLSILSIYNFQLKKRLAAQETERLQELDRLKTKFFADIAHEFRTPLTVILGMVGTIKGNLKAQELIQRNGNNMLNLVNQMLDLRKLEAGKLPLNIVQADIVSYLKYVFESFDSYAQENHIKLHFLPDTPVLVMDYDPDKILKIVSNLVSNAIKYNKPGGHVYLQISEEGEEQQHFLSIRVKDTGVGIAAEALDKIFDRFYQTKEQQENTTKPGTGIGLSLTRELVKLFKGDIKVKSQRDEGTEFQLRLPISNHGPLSNVSMADQHQLEKGAASNYLRQPTLSEYIFADREPAQQNGESQETKLLIIEDNVDVVEYLRTCLESTYDLSIAYDGQAGIRLALENVPDIIISDVMMPKKDGFEVLATLKADERTSHIPFVMLTAKSDLESKIQGLKTGAEVYLAKPFHQEELLVHLDNLLQNRKKLQEHYQSILKEKTQEDDKTFEDVFVQKIITTVETHLEDESFNIPMLCKALKISRTQLHNKLKALTGLSTSHFVNSIRLRKGHELLLQTDLTVAEIAYRVGYKEPNYFSRLYNDFFGKSPTETRKSL